jgi:glycosyltransferase involved in cell wall biosynthesis
MGASVDCAPAELDVLAVIDHLALGGAEMLLGQFAAAAPRAGIRLSVACFERIDGSPAAEPLRAAGIEPVNLEVEGRPGRRHLQAMRRHLRAVAPQIVHTHLGTADLIGGLAARSRGLPAVSTIHEIIPRYKGTARAKAAVSTLGRRLCDARVITVSDSARRAYLEQSWGMGERVVRIYNGVDVAALPGSGAEVRHELGIAPDELLVGMVSALRPEKAHDVAIEAIATLRERFPRLRLLIVGQGRRELRAELERLAAPLGDRVLLAGRRTDVMRVFDALDVCLHPSRMDAFPTTLIEALAASVPVLASEVGGIPEIIDDGRTGVLVPAPPRAPVLAEALATLLEDAGRRTALASAGRASYERHFTADPWVHRTRALYDEVLAQSRARRRQRTPDLGGRRLSPEGTRR